MPVSIPIQDNILFKGKAVVRNGIFAIDFILPKEVALNQGALRMQFYASSTNADMDALGVYDSLYVNEFSENISTDTIGPQFEHVYINDTLNNYKPNTWINSNSSLYIYLKDSSGIQTSGNSLGHDISLVIDGASQSPIILNNYFTADINTYQSGKVIYALPSLSAGPHQFIIKAWDLIGNSNKDTLNIIVPNSDHLLIRNLSNFPNPFRTNTRISFEISQTINLNKSLVYTIEIFNNLGVKQLSKTFETGLLNNRVVVANFDEIAALQAGTYFYKLWVKDDKQGISLINKFIKY